MSPKKKIHFEISERKILLRFFDIFFVFLFLQIIGHFFNFDYFAIKIDNYYWALVLVLYLMIIGTIFEMYNLQVASNHYQITKSIILTAAVTTLTYLLTPFYTPILPSNRLQIIFFFLAIFTALLVWRYLYIQLLASQRFFKNVLFVGSSKKIEDQINELVKDNPHYIVRGFIPTDERKKRDYFPRN